MFDVVITKHEINNNECILSLIYESEKKTLIECNVTYAADTAPVTGGIYIGKVKNISKNLDAAFVEVKKGFKCYLPFAELKNVIYVKRHSENKVLCLEDEIVVQIIKDAVKTKDPVATCNITLTSGAVVTTLAEGTFGVSSKLDSQTKKDLKKEFSYVFDEYSRGNGLVLRTNATHLDKDELKAEIILYLEKINDIKEKAKFKTCYTTLYEPVKSYFTPVINLKAELINSIVTDNKELFEELNNFICKEYHLLNLKDKICFYTDEAYSLKKLYSVEGKLEDARKKMVWLKSGANLYIEVTEALTVIDINSGKNVSKKNSEENHYLINKEAIKEIAHQIRLRNLSGIILADLIDMKDKSLFDDLLVEMNGYLKNDPCEARAVDITALGLMEITRKKIKKSLAEQIKIC